MRYVLPRPTAVDNNVPQRSSPAPTPPTLYTPATEDRTRLSLRFAAQRSVASSTYQRREGAIGSNRVTLGKLGAIRRNSSQAESALCCPAALPRIQFPAPTDQPRTPNFISEFGRRFRGYTPMILRLDFYRPEGRELVVRSFARTPCAHQKAAGGPRAKLSTLQYYWARLGAAPFSPPNMICRRSRLRMLSRSQAIYIRNVVLLHGGFINRKGKEGLPKP